MNIVDFIHAACAKGIPGGKAYLVAEEIIAQIRRGEIIPFYYPENFALGLIQPAPLGMGGVHILGYRASFTVRLRFLADARNAGFRYLVGIPNDGRHSSIYRRFGFTQCWMKRLWE